MQATYSLADPKQKVTKFNRIDHALRSAGYIVAPGEIAGRSVARHIRPIAPIVSKAGSMEASW